MSTVFLLGLGLVALGGVAALLLLRAPRAGAAAFAVLAATGCALLAAAAVGALAGHGWVVRVPARVPGGAWAFGVDPLAAFFLLAVALVGGAAAVYGAGLLGGGQRGAAAAHAGVALLVVALALVVTARAVVPFLMALEIMAIAAFLLVMFDHEQAQTRRAGLVYLAAAHAALLVLIAMFAAWSRGAPDLTFASLRAAAAAHRAPATAILVLALVGFGLKAGIVPLHFWLPGAHAAAPSHVSALMSGLVIKAGIYGLLRTMALLGGVPAWFGWTVLALGVVSGVLGVVWALAQHDLKRLLAYHSVENIGIILIGMGTGALGAAYGRPAVAALGIAGAVLHVLNHATFKGLLFLGAGAVAHATHTRQMDALGGLARAMPLTFLAFLVGSAAIVGLPPLNGFVSEWTIVLGLVGAGAGDAPGALRVAICGVGALGLIGGLALACFAKVNGVVFLGRARTAAAEHAHEPGGAMVAPLLVLALACLAIGLLPWLVVPRALAAAAVVTGAVTDAAAPARAAQAVSLFAVLLVAALAAAYGLRRLLLRGRVRRVALPWGCGYPAPTPRMQYTAASFAQPLLEPFGALAGIHAERHGDRFETHALDPALLLLEPAWRRMQSAGRRLRSYHAGRLHVYLLYVLATVIALLVYFALRHAS